MADSTAAAGSEESEPQIKFNIKTTGDVKHELVLPASTTIADVKAKISTSEYFDVPADRQRLIYSGRVLKDHDTIANCKIKEGNTVHLHKQAESNTRQNPANQSGATAVPPGAGQPASNVPQNIAAGTGAANPLAQLTGARYAGFHGLPGADTFGADGGMGAPPNPDQMLRLLEDPNFASQMNEAMNNPAVVDMLRNNPMIRNNPIARQAIENPEFRRMMMNPDMIRMQMQMQRAMGGPGGMGGGDSAFPMPGQTDTTQPSSGEGVATGGGTTATPQQTDTTGTPNANTQNLGGGANPFSALFPGMGGQAGGDSNQQNPWANIFGGGAGGAGGDQGGGNQNNPMAAMTQQLMQNPEMMQQMMQMMGGMNAGGGAGSEGGAGAGAGANPFGGAGGFNPFAFGDFGGAGQQQQPQQPPDSRAPEERYENELRQLNDMGFYEFERNVQALRRSGGSVQGAVEYLLTSI